jgi:phosphoribosylglycinamide formyltransferase 2
MPCVVKCLRPERTINHKNKRISKSMELCRGRFPWRCGRSNCRSFCQIQFRDYLLTVVQNNKTLLCANWSPRTWRLSGKLATRQNIRQGFVRSARHGRKSNKLWVAQDFWVEFFLTDDGVYFSELSPRPHDRNGNLAGTQNFNEFELHLRAILSLPIFEITLEKRGASAVILASENSTINLFRNRKYCFIQNRFQNLWQTNFKTVKNGCGFSQWYFRNSIEEVVEKAKQPVWLPCTRNLFNRFLY